jgi:hypothetical protein
VKVEPGTMETIEREAVRASGPEASAYLAGASRDGSYSRTHRTLRITQRDRRWLVVLQTLLELVGSRGWIYREGARDIWTIETVFHPSDPGERAAPPIQRAYVRGYFDAEGGIPREASSRFYIQLTQKDKADLMSLRHRLVEMGIRCGKLHNPSMRVDPHYFRFYVLSGSHTAFMRGVNSWHPAKRALLTERLNRPPASADLEKRWI